MDLVLESVTSHSKAWYCGELISAKALADCGERTTICARKLLRMLINGSLVGGNVGSTTSTGALVGLFVGDSVGFGVGAMVGLRVGDGVGFAVGAFVAPGRGAGVGAFVGGSVGGLGVRVGSVDDATAGEGELSLRLAGGLIFGLFKAGGSVKTLGEGVGPSRDDWDELFSVSRLDLKTTANITIATTTASNSIISAILP
jgi:hypothetical protein